MGKQTTYPVQCFSAQRKESTLSRRLIWNTLNPGALLLPDAIILFNLQRLEAQ